MYCTWYKPTFQAAILRLSPMGPFTNSNPLWITGDNTSFAIRDWSWSCGARQLGGRIGEIIYCHGLHLSLEVPSLYISLGPHFLYSAALRPCWLHKGTIWRLWLGHQHEERNLRNCLKILFLKEMLVHQGTRNLGAHRWLGSGFSPELPRYTVTRSPPNSGDVTAVDSLIIFFGLQRRMSTKLPNLDGIVVHGWNHRVAHSKNKNDASVAKSG